MSKQTKALTTQQAATGMASILDAGERALAKLDEFDQFHKAIGMVYGLIEMQAAITDDGIASLMYMQGNPLAFKTDKKDGYPPEVVRDCAITAILHGAHIVGNEFNIIAGQTYLTKEYYERSCRQYPGVTDLEVIVELPERVAGMLVCGGLARCRVDGKSVQVFARKTEQGDTRLAVSAYQDDVDNAQGKVRKRLLQRLFERIAGVSLSGDDAPVQIASEPIATDTVSEPQGIDWKAELYAHGGPESWTVKCGRRIYQASESAKPVDGIASELAEARGQIGNAIDQRAYNTLERYAGSFLPDTTNA